MSKQSRAAPISGLIAIGGCRQGAGGPASPATPSGSGGNPNGAKADLADDTACALFRVNAGANAPEVDVSTAAARRKAYSLLLSRVVIRTTFPVLEASKRQYDVLEAHDPYSVGSATAS